MFRQSIQTFAVFLLLILFGFTSTNAQSLSLWLSNKEETSLLAKQPRTLSFITGQSATLPVVEINPDQKFQTMDGFGFALTGGSAQHLLSMTTAARAKLLQELFGHAEGAIGISYLRVSIGASDLNDHVFSYDDLKQGETDVQLKKFNLNVDTIEVIPVLKEILAINPKIKILASPWSAPLWMKTNNNIQGGKLKEEYYGVYANYFLKYIQQMKRAGVVIDAITIQNEPFNNLNTPSMQMFAKEQLRFIRDHLGPLFARTKTKTKIILYDHNCDAPEYPISVLTDSKAAQYIDGSGFHLYTGQTSAMTKVHEAYPQKNLYFTEMMAVSRNGFNIATPVDRILIGATRNWSKNVILWNLAANSKNEPHTDNGGCSVCQGAITLEKDQVTRNTAYYVIGHAAKFINPGAVRIASTQFGDVGTVAFQNPSKQIILIAANKGQSAQTFNILYKGKSVQVNLAAGAVGTYVW